eukprot:jgi/Bigna1/146616/aug1.118_g21324
MLSAISGQTEQVDVAWEGPARGKSSRVPSFTMAHGDVQYSALRVRRRWDKLKYQGDDEEARAARIRYENRMRLKKMVQKWVVPSMIGITILNAVADIATSSQRSSAPFPLASVEGGGEGGSSGWYADVGGTPIRISKGGSGGGSSSDHGLRKTSMVTGGGSSGSSQLNEYGGHGGDAKKREEEERARREEEEEAIRRQIKRDKQRYRNVAVASMTVAAGFAGTNWLLVKLEKEGYSVFGNRGRRPPPIIAPQQPRRHPLPQGEGAVDIGASSDSLHHLQKEHTSAMSGTKGRGDGITAATHDKTSSFHRTATSSRLNHASALGGAQKNKNKQKGKDYNPTGTASKTTGAASGRKKKKKSGSAKKSSSENKKLTPKAKMKLRKKLVSQ